MKKWTIIAFCLLSKMGLTQSDNIAEKKDTIINKQILENNSDDIICIFPPVPEFNGGLNAMYQFLSDNMKMPKFDSLKTKDLNIGCYTVYIGFLVTKKGDIRNVKTKRGIKDFPEFEEEAMRVVKLMDGKWTAAKQNGVFVDLNYTLPIKFTIE
jgi:Gram-negative bacterial TonB protein C-terminal